MDDTVGILLFLGGGFLFSLAVQHYYRRWKAGKLADKLLADVIKGKDAFRRR